MDFRICDCDGVTMAKKKYRWYKDLWGWIGFFTYPLIVYLISQKYPNLNNISIFARTIIYPLELIGKMYKSITDCSGLDCLEGLFFVFGTIPLIGFLGGLLIHKLFIKLRWVRR